jgi:CBS domain containing-hemolysin-like protein
VTEGLFLLGAVALVLVNGFFVAAEFALVKLRQTRVKGIERRFGLRGRLLGRVHANLDAYLSACQLGITLASIGLGWIGEPAMARLLQPVLAAMSVTSPQLVHGTSFLAAFSLIAYLHIVVGEMAPKSMALRRAEGIALWTAPPLYVFYWSMWPAIWLLNRSANWILRAVGLSAAHSLESTYTTDELKLILRSSSGPSRLTQDELRILAHALDFSTLTVAELKRPAGEMVSLYADRSLEENLETIRTHRYTRYPFFSRSGGEVIGLIHVKDLLTRLRPDGVALDLKKLARAPFRVVESMPAMHLFRRFREGYPHFAIVLDGGGHVSGFITLDNMLSVLVGEISDEFRQSQSDWIQQEDGTLLGKASLSVFSLERALGIDIEGHNVDTVGGLIHWKLERLPEEGERVDFDRFAIVVRKMRGPRIQLVKVIPVGGAESEVTPASEAAAR